VLEKYDKDEKKYSSNSNSLTDSADLSKEEDENNEYDDDDEGIGFGRRPVKVDLSNYY